MTEKTYFRLFANCQVVEGAAKNLIYDLHLKRFLKFPKNITAFILEDFVTHPIKKVIEQYPDLQEVLLQYLEFLVDNDFGFYTTSPNSFPPLSPGYHSPHVVSDCQLLICDLNRLRYREIIYELLDLGCNGFQVILTDRPEFEQLADLLRHFKTSRAIRVELLLPEDFFSPDSYKKLLEDKRLIVKCFNTPEPREQISINRLIRTSAKLDYNLPQTYSEDSMLIDLAVFTEAQQHNIGLNRKVCIDESGGVKHYASHEKVYGEVSDLRTIVQSSEFRKKWDTSNDHIEICDNCQYRYACHSISDLEEKEGKWYKVDYCTFDPLNGNW